MTPSEQEDLDNILQLIEEIDEILSAVTKIRDMAPEDEKPKHSEKIDQLLERRFKLMKRRDSYKK